MGIGGGPLIVPLLQLFFDYTAKSAVTISYVMIFAAGLGGNVQKYIKYKDSSENYLDYDLLLIALPALCSGSLFG